MGAVASFVFPVFSASHANTPRVPYFVFKVAGASGELGLFDLLFFRVSFSHSLRVCGCFTFTVHRTILRSKNLGRHPYAVSIHI